MIEMDILHFPLLINLALKMLICLYFERSFGLTCFRETDMSKWNMSCNKEALMEPSLTRNMNGLIIWCKNNLLKKLFIICFHDACLLYGYYIILLWVKGKISLPCVTNNAPVVSSFSGCYPDEKQNHKYKIYLFFSMTLVIR